MGAFKEMLNNMNPKVISYMQDHPDMLEEIKDDLNSKLDMLLDLETLHGDTVLEQFRIEMISRISHELARHTGQGYIDCMEVAEFYCDRMRML